MARERGVRSIDKSMFYGIKINLKDGKRRAVIAEDYGISKSTVDKISGCPSWDDWCKNKKKRQKEYSEKRGKNSDRKIHQSEEEAGTEVDSVKKNDSERESKMSNFLVGFLVFYAVGCITVILFGLAVGITRWAFEF